MQKHDDGSLTLTPEESLQHAKALEGALMVLKKGSEVARKSDTRDPFGAGACSSVFILDTSGSMSDDMSGNYGADWSNSKMCHLHELMTAIMQEVQPIIICIGKPPENERIQWPHKPGAWSRLCVMEDNHPCSIYGAWLTETLQTKARGGTPLWCGLQLALNNDWTDVTVISDGLPQDTDMALDLANRFQRIDAWFLGNGDSYSSTQGRDFMRKLHRGAGTFGSTNLGDDNVRRLIGNKCAGYLGGYGTGG